MAHKVTVERNRLKFAAGHFATFADELEPIHGHNYAVMVEIDGPLTEESWVVDFSLLKRLSREICEGLDHKFLLQMDSRVLSIEDDGSHFNIRYKDEQPYRLPKHDVAGAADRQYDRRAALPVHCRATLRRPRRGGPLRAAPTPGRRRRDAGPSGLVRNRILPHGDRRLDLMSTKFWLGVDPVIFGIFAVIVFGLLVILGWQIAAEEDSVRPRVFRGETVTDDSRRADVAERAPDGVVVQDPEGAVDVLVPLGTLIQTLVPEQVSGVQVGDWVFVGATDDNVNSFIVKGVVVVDDSGVR